MRIITIVSVLASLSGPVMSAEPALEVHMQLAGGQFPYRTAEARLSAVDFYDNIASQLDQSVSPLSPREEEWVRESMSRLFAAEPLDVRAVDRLTTTPEFAQLKIVNAVKNMNYALKRLRQSRTVEEEAYYWVVLAKSALDLRYSEGWASQLMASGRATGSAENLRAALTLGRNAPETIYGILETLLAPGPAS